MEAPLRAHKIPDQPSNPCTIHHPVPEMDVIIWKSNGSYYGKI